MKKEEKVNLLGSGRVKWY